MAVSQRASTTVVVENPKQKSVEPEFPDIQTIRNAIPAHCFEASLWTSFYYVFRDLTMVSALVWAALTYIPTIQDPIARVSAWMVYGFVQGLVCTGVWILGHECGHGAFSKYTRLNDVVGWFLHSFLLVPYFSWKFSHHRHHRFTGNMTKDMAFVPAVQPLSAANAKAAKKEQAAQEPWYVGIDWHELLEDTPIHQAVNLIFHQLFGWQVYLFLNATAGKGSKQREVSTLGSWLNVSHFDPTSAVFRPNEAMYIVITDIGLCLMLGALYYASTLVGAANVLFLYAVPYMWVHHWLGKYKFTDRSL